MENKNPFSGSSVCIVGNVNRDVKARAVPGTSNLFQDGETSIPPIVETIGGGGANSACAAASLGARVHFLGKIGSDRLGAELATAMERAGVHTYLSKDNACTTGTTLALGFTSGNRHFLSCLPNNQSLCFQDLDLTALDHCRHLLRADVWFSPSMLEEGNERLLSEARRRGLTTSLDINFDPVWSTGSAREKRRRKQLLRNVLPLVDIAHGNVRELREFTDCSDLQSSLKKLADWGVGSVVVHMGVRGAGFYIVGELVIEPANRARRVIHSTGTGDVLSICMVLLHTTTALSVRQKLRISNRVVCEFMEGRRALLASL